MPASTCTHDTGQHCEYAVTARAGLWQSHLEDVGRSEPIAALEANLVVAGVQPDFHLGVQAYAAPLDSLGQNQPLGVGPAAGSPQIGCPR